MIHIYNLLCVCVCFYLRQPISRSLGQSTFRSENSSISRYEPVVHGAMGYGRKSFKLLAVPPAPDRVPSQKSLAPSVISISNDKDDNKMILGAVHRSAGICLTALYLSNCILSGAIH